jgi:RsiW-degrading membrane proteinase PrsW (M82 family)
LPCFAHQLNLCIGEVFKESTDLKVSMNHAIKFATYFRNANNKFFIAKLRDQQKITYGKYYTLAVLGETRWNSYYEVCTSVLRIQQALQVNFTLLINNAIN